MGSRRSPLIKQEYTKEHVSNKCGCLWTGHCFSMTLLSGSNNKCFAKRICLGSEFFVFNCLYFPGRVTPCVCGSFASWEHNFTRKCHFLDLLWPVMWSRGRKHSRGGRSHPQQTGSSARSGSCCRGVLCDELRAGLHVSRPLPAAQLAHCGRQHRRVTERARGAQACSQHPTPPDHPPLPLLAICSLHPLLQLPGSFSRVSRGSRQSRVLSQLRAAGECPHSSPWWRAELWHLLLSLLLH